MATPTSLLLAPASLTLAALLPLADRFGDKNNPNCATGNGSQASPYCDVQDVSITVNLLALPTPTGPVAALSGQTWYFQAWHRDSLSGVATSNFTTGLAVQLQ